MIVRQILLKFGKFAAISIGATFFILFADYSLALWYGSKLVNNGEYNNIYGRNYTVGDVITIFFSIMMGGFSLGSTAPCVKAFTKGKCAAYNIF